MSSEEEHFHLPLPQKQVTFAAWPSDCCHLCGLSPQLCAWVQLCAWIQLLEQEVRLLMSTNKMELNTHRQCHSHPLPPELELCGENALPMAITLPMEVQSDMSCPVSI